MGWLDTNTVVQGSMAPRGSSIKYFSSDKRKALEVFSSKWATSRGNFYKSRFTRSSTIHINNQIEMYPWMSPFLLPQYRAKWAFGLGYSLMPFSMVAYPLMLTFSFEIDIKNSTIRPLFQKGFTGFPLSIFHWNFVIKSTIKFLLICFIF